jgi:hypothetical protein
MARTFVSGQRSRKLPTRALNEAIEFARDAEVFGDRQNAKPLDGQFLISVRNDTVDTDFERFDAVGLEGALINPIENEIGFIGGINIGAIVPTFNHVSRFAIALEPIKPGRMGKALLYGITPALIDVVSLGHKFCQPVDGDVTLTTVDFGGARLIWPTAPTSLGEQFAYVLLTGSGQATTGERISGELYTPLAGATKPNGDSREPGSAVLRVWTTDPDNKLEDQTHNRYAITEVNPTDPLNLSAGQSFVIDTDVRFRLVQNQPIYVVESTSRDGTYRVEPVVDAVTWDAGTGKCTIKTSNAIAVVLDPAPPNDPIVDGVILIPGGDGRMPSDRYEMVLNYAGHTGNANSWCVAIHDGASYQVTYVDS